MITLKILMIIIQVISAMLTVAHNQKIEKDILDAISIQNHECGLWLSFINICSEESPISLSFRRNIS